MFNLNYKPILFAITAVVMLAAIATVTLYTVDTANAQGNVTNATGNMLKNMTNSTADALKGDIIRNAIPPM
jgi:hypothetical protein